jgi:hypothetical protein
MNEMDFAGRWRVTKALGLVEDYLSLTPDTLLLKMHYHMGDTYTFICKRN